MAARTKKLTGEEEQATTSETDKGNRGTLGQRAAAPVARRAVKPSKPPPEA